VAAKLHGSVRATKSVDVSIDEGNRDAGGD
jgi:hypothetical protein